MADDPEKFVYADASDTGVATPLECFVSPLSGGEIPTAEALILKETGFLPVHPYHSGSGDHVNSNQLADAVRQFVNIWRREPHVLKEGEIRFTHYVELDHAFNIELTDWNSEENRVSITISQAGKNCAQFTMIIESAG